MIAIMNTSKAGFCDVLIVGGGLVGASLAIALSRAGVATTLVEARPSNASLADPERERYLALARASVNALHALGVWSELAPHAAPIRAVHVSRRGDFGRTLLRAGDHGVDCFGAVVPASRLGSALESALQRCACLTRVTPALLRSFECQHDVVQALIDHVGEERSIHASLLVGADGAESFVRSQTGLPTERDDYGQDALVVSVGLSRDHQGIAYERFTDDGAIALLPLPDRRAGLVWTLTRARAEQIASLSAVDWLACMQAEFGHRLGRFHSPGRLIRYPLSRSFATKTTRERVVLVGNAAQSLHPVAAQGFNLGLRDALVLAEEFAAVSSHQAQSALASSRVRADEPIAADQIGRLLSRYGERRHADRERIAALSHWLARWPKLHVPGAGVARSMVFGALNAWPALQESLVLAAMGFADDAPALTLASAA